MAPGVPKDWRPGSSKTLKEGTPPQAQAAGESARMEVFLHALLFLEPQGPRERDFPRQELVEELSRGLAFDEHRAGVGLVPLGRRGQGGQVLGQGNGLGLQGLVGREVRGRLADDPAAVLELHAVLRLGRGLHVYLDVMGVLLSLPALAVEEVEVLLGPVEPDMGLLDDGVILEDRGEPPHLILHPASKPGSVRVPWP